jgi:streptogrisin C
MIGTLAVAALLAVAPAQTYDVRGGDVFTSAGYRCTIGFSVNGGYVTTDQCGAPTGSTTGYNGVSQGVYEAMPFPGDGSAYVRTNASWIPRGVVNPYGGATVQVRGSTPAPVGATACRSGGATSWHCGIIQARNVTVSFPERTLYGLILTNICAESGDIGGPLISGGQAQGILVARTGDCASGGSSYYRPINDVLQKLGLTLVTS